LFLSREKIGFKKVGGRGDNTRFHRQHPPDTQFSLGEANVIRLAKLARGFLKFFVICMMTFKHLYFGPV